MHPATKKLATVVAGAAVLALAANGVSVAATGHGLVGGRHNATTSTTTIGDSSPGPALKLTSSGDQQPSLEVSSSARVPHLNASMLRNKTASQLATHAETYTAGGGNPVFTDDVSYALDIAPGLYSASFDAVIGPSDGSPTAPTNVYCGIFPMGPAPAYAFDSTSYTGGIPALVSASNIVRVQPGGTVLYCYASSAQAQFLQPIRASFVRVDTVATHHAPRLTPAARPQGAFTR